jgi:hypothetical protein
MDLDEPSDLVRDSVSTGADALKLIEALRDGLFIVMQFQRPVH